MKAVKLNVKVLLSINAILGLLAFLSAIVFCIILNIAGDVFIPLVIAWFILQLIRPVIQVGNKLHLHSSLNLMLVFLLLIGLSFLGLRFFTAQAADFNRVYTRYAPELGERFTKIMTGLGISPEMILSFNWVNFLINFLQNNARNITSAILTLSNKLFMTLFFLMFMLVEAPYTERKIDRAFSGKTRKMIRNIRLTISQQISYYLVNQTLISLATAFFAWVVLWAMGVELATGWAMLTFLLNFIPNVGSIIATILPVIMAGIQFPTFFEPIIVLAALTVIQMILGNIIGPRILSDSLGVSSVVILLSLLLWSMIWGIPGALLSVPIASIIKIVCENIPSLHPIAVLMGNGAAAIETPSPLGVRHHAKALEVKTSEENNEDSNNEDK